LVAGPLGVVGKHVSPCAGAPRPAGNNRSRAESVVSLGAWYAPRWCESTGQGCTCLEHILRTLNVPRPHGEKVLHGCSKTIFVVSVRWPQDTKWANAYVWLSRFFSRNHPAFCRIFFFENSNVDFTCV
jgi:hypothetical protein